MSRSAVGAARRQRPARVAVASAKVATKAAKPAMAAIESDPSTPVPGSFKTVALDRFEKKKPGCSEVHAAWWLRVLEANIFPFSGNRQIDSITVAEMRAVLQESRIAARTNSRRMFAPPVARSSCTPTQPASL